MPHFKATQLYIKLDKKLIFHAKSISVTNGNASQDDESLLPIPIISPLINFSRRNFQSFTIDELNIDGHKVTFSYMDNPLSEKDNSITVKSDEIDASIFYHIHESHIDFDMPIFIHKPSKLTMNAKAVHDFKKNETFSIIKISLPDCTNMQVFAKNNAKALAFTASSDVFYDLAPIIQLFKLKKNTVKWIVDKNSASSYQLLQAKGIYGYTDPDLILRTLSLHAKETDVSYTFNNLLYPIRSDEVDVYFAHGVLDILPSKPKYNTHIIDRGTVNLDFNSKHVMLTVDLNIDTKLDQDIVDIVKAYDISLPLLQEKGKTRTDLNLVVDLFTENASVQGRFFVKQSDLFLNGVKYKIKNASIRLNKSFLSIDTAKVSYEDIFTAEINGHLDLVPLSGDFFFDVEKVSLPLSSDTNISLLSKDTRVQLHFTKKGRSFITPSTLWSYNDLNITVDKNTIKMLEKFSSVASFKDVGIQAQDYVNFNLSGNYDIKNSYADLDINSSKFHYLDQDLNVSSLDKTLDFHLIHENNQTMLNTLVKHTFLINENRLEIMPTTLIFKDDHLDINNTQVSVNNELSSTISSHYQLGSKKAKVTAINTMLFSDDILLLEPSFDLFYNKKQGQHYIDINEYGIHVLLNDRGEIDLNIKDFSKIHPYSKKMQLYDIKNGHANLTIIGDSVGVDMTLTDFHPLLSKNGTDITSYSVKGIYDNKTANLQINKDIDLLYRKKGKLSAKNIDFNLFPILDYIKHIDTNDEKNDLDLIVKTTKCNVTLGSSGRKLIADSIKMQIKENSINAQLIHAKGGVLFESNDQNISVFGRGLNDAFMSHLFKFSTFKGGELSFVMQGPIDDMDGIININKTVIKDYTVLNNILAFFNTIPSLVTFSVPDYSKSGLYVEEMYSAFHKTGPKIKIRDTKLSSKELVITAEGGTDFDEESVDLLLQVKTDLGSSAKNIPVLGYIIFGEDSVSTTVRVHGPLSDPKVESSVAKSIIAAPFNIIKRTLSLPFTSLGLFDEDDNTSQEK